jgi:hypothetical protein
MLHDDIKGRNSEEIEEYNRREIWYKRQVTSIDRNRKKRAWGKKLIKNKKK